MEIDPDALMIAQQEAAARPDMLVALHSIDDAACVWASPSHVDVLGYDPAGLKWASVVAPEDQKHMMVLRDTVELSGGWSVEAGIRLKTKSGGRVNIRMIGVLVEQPEGPPKYVMTRMTSIDRPRRKSA